MVHLRAVQAGELTETDIKWLVAAARVMYDPMEAWEFVDQQLEGIVQIWRVEGRAEGVVVTALHNDGQVLFISSMAGKGFLTYHKEFFAEVERIAKRARVSFIRAQTVRPGLAKFYTKLLSARQVATVHQLEVDYGR